MQKEITSKLQLIIAKLELKQLEVVESLSRGHNDDFIIRCVTDPETNKFLAVNGDWENVTGLKESSCVGRDWFDFLGDNDSCVKSETNDLLEGDNGFTNYECLLKTIGDDVLVSWTAKLFPEINAMVSIGRVSKLNLISKNVRHFKSEEVLANKEKEKTLVDFFENNNIPMHQVNSEGIIVNANQADLDNLGYTRDEYIGTMAKSHFVDKDAFDYVLAELNANRTLWKFKTKLIKKNKEIIDVSFMSSTNGDLTRCVIIPD